eukprot:6486814-Amphidinium_carterae.5
MNGSFTGSFMCSVTFFGSNFGPTQRSVGSHRAIVILFLCLLFASGIGLRCLDHDAFEVVGLARYGALLALLMMLQRNRGEVLQTRPGNLGDDMRSVMYGKARKALTAEAKKMSRIVLLFLQSACCTSLPHGEVHDMARLVRRIGLMCFNWCLSI